MPKERTINPAAAQRKADKAKSIKKGKAQTQTLRNEKLAKRNPDRLQKQVDDLKAIETSGGKLTSNEKTILEGLEKEVKAVRKARELAGAPQSNDRNERGDRDRGDRDRNDRGGRGGFGEGRGGRGGSSGFLGKRRRDDASSSDEAEDIPEELRKIPMPRDTPPPFPKEVLDKWYQARRDKRARFAQNDDANNNQNSGGRIAGGTNANSTPLGANDRSAGFADRADSSTSATAEKAQERKKEEAKTVYESAPLIRDLRKEAVAFVPAVVRKKLDMAKGLGAVGGLMEPEEADQLERAGYLGSNKKSGEEEEVEGESGYKAGRGVMMEEVEDEDG